jgi:hypothetical protein
MSRDFDSYADAYLRTAKDLESDFKAAAEGAFKRMYAHTCVMRKAGPNHPGVEELQNEFFDFEAIAKQMIACLESWDLHA